MDRRTLDNDGSYIEPKTPKSGDKILSREIFDITILLSFSFNVKAF